MENISKVIEAVFGHISGDYILTSAGYKVKGKSCKQDTIHLDTSIRESELVRNLLQVDHKSTIDQISMIGQVAQNKWMMPDDSCTNLKFYSTDSVFNILLHFSAAILVVKDGEPLCRYHQLLRWHNLTTLVGEDLLTTSFLASRDLQWGIERNSFDWDACIGHSCKEINYLFRKPMAELHMHLKGSSYNFDLSWLCVMNHIEDMQEGFNKSVVARQYTETDGGMYEKIKRAAAIRYYLAGIVGCIKTNFTSADLCSFLADDIRDLEHRKRELEGYRLVSLQDEINKSRIQTRQNTVEEFS